MAELDKLKAALDVIESIATSVFADKEVQLQRKRARPAIEHAHVCLTSMDEDFIIHARDQAAPGRSLEDGLVR